MHNNKTSQRTLKGREVYQFRQFVQRGFPRIRESKQTARAEDSEFQGKRRTQRLGELIQVKKSIGVVPPGDENYVSTYVACSTHTGNLPRKISWKAMWKLHILNPG